MKAPHFVLIVTAVGLLAACSQPEPSPEPIRSVKLMTVTASPQGVASEYAGEIRARVESQPGFRVAGKLVERLVEPGQQVRQGQLLARLDPRDFALAEQALQAQVLAATTQRDLAAAELRRFQDLRRQGFISDAEIERRRAAVDAAEAALRQARAQLAVQGNQASDTRLVADADGLVTSVMAEVGQVLAAGAPVLRLAHVGAREAWISVPEDRVPELRTGMPAQVRLWAGVSGPSTRLTPARVREVAGSADRVTRTFLVKLSLEGGEAVPLGATAYVRMDPVVAEAGRAAEGVKLPTSALRRKGEDTAVWLFDAGSGTVQTRVVQVLTADGNEVLVAGLEPGQEVVTAGVHVLTEGQTVTRFATPATR
ncbi:MAG TPA: efflux RND transporter periplasmic adaptor subunit [Hydrogenophaga sp.]|uniref:efflux RND transporter periplasmic adaptor subunit n=1 Tax=Hydrogenophaga sp. TaxID=1904254 RepID=UPI002D102DD4|nr:efflux RND transporter periplasmic adaptor subunit [Hydrogenophaga sp.]HMN92973.1 efflux RND transporter periplasmic adaptor subunit [Hydrogenophaga sp.]HMP09141.1 efflux RND transporter periplasmic adaptor subunit [Hydrogenophaga sp.]